MSGTPENPCIHILSNRKCKRAVEVTAPGGEGMMSLNRLMLPVGDNLICKVKDMTPAGQQANCEGFEESSSQA